MYYVYILTDANENIYIGRTNDLERRLGEHRRNKTITTSRMGNIKLYYYEAYLTKSLSLEREKRLKHFGSAYKGLLKRIGLC